MGKLQQGVVHAVCCTLALLFVRQGSNAETNAATPGRFVDLTGKLGIHFKQEASPTSRKYLLETMGSGVALFDYANDGRLDIFFATGARLDDPTAKGTMPQKDGAKYWNRLYHQNS